MITGEVSKKTPRQAGLTILLVAIVLLGAALRLYNLDGSSFWLDEISTALTAREDVASILRFHLEEAGNPPLVSLITHAFFVLWGENEFMARLPAALLGSLSILLIYKAGCLMWDERAALIGALLLAVNPGHVEYSQEARHYALMVFLALLSLIFLLLALWKNRVWLWLGFALSLVLSIYNHYFALLFLPAEVALGTWIIAESWLGRRRKAGHAAADPGSSDSAQPRKQAVMFTLSLLLVGMLYLPWIPALQAQFPKQLHSVGISVSASSLKSSLVFLRDVLFAFSGTQSLVLVAWLGTFLLGLLTSGVKRAAFVLLWMGVPFIFIGVIDPDHPILPRYVLFALPIYLLVIANGLIRIARLSTRGLSRMAHPGDRARPAITAVMVAAFGALSLVSVWNYYRCQKEDWRDATTYLVGSMAEGDIIVADGQAYGQGGDSNRAAKALSYYFSKCDKEVTILHARQGLAGDVEQWEGSGSDVWGVLWHINETASVEGTKIERFPRVTVVAPPDGEIGIVEQTASLLEALLLIQPVAEGRFDLHLALADLYNREGDWERAMEHARLAEERLEDIRSDPAQALGAMAALHLSLGEPIKALAAIQQAAEIAPHDTRLMLLLGEAYQGLGRIEEATQVYQDLLKMDPDDEWAARRLRMFSHPLGEEIPNPLLRSFGLEVAMLGYDLHPESVEVGGTVDLTLWWQALANMDRDYTTFVHLTNADGRLWAQEDHLLLFGVRPTSSWRLGLVVKDLCQLRLPPDIPPGDYVVTVGIYYWETKERLPVWNGYGQRSADDTAGLQSIAVHD